MLGALIGGRGERPGHGANAGKVSALGADSITVATLAGQTKTYTVNAQTRIAVRGVKATLADIKVGYGIAFAGEMADNKMTAAHVSFVPPAIKGVVESRNGDTVTIKTVRGKIITGATTDKTVVLLRPRTAPNELGKLADVKNGAPVNVGGHITGENAMQVIYIDVLTGG